MSPFPSERTRQMLSQSLPLVQAHRHDLIDRVHAGLALAEPDRNPGQSEVNAMVLVEMLLAQVRHLLDSGAFQDLEKISDEHEALLISGRTYSRFGDLLVPILKDLLGPNVPGAVPGAWCDTFWRLIRESAAQPVLEAA